MPADRRDFVRRATGFGELPAGGLPQPCELQRRASPASLHQTRIALPKPDAVNGAPQAVVRKVRLPAGTAANASERSDPIGISPSHPVFC